MKMRKIQRDSGFGQMNISILTMSSALSSDATRAMFLIEVLKISSFVGFLTGSRKAFETVQSELIPRSTYSCKLVNLKFVRYCEFLN